jgi:deoxycytidylate deaminase
MELIKETIELTKIVYDLVETAKLASCKRSKCGSLIVSPNGNIIGRGYNSMPCDLSGECFKESLSPTFKSDKTCCIHAEQRAIMDALKNSPNDIIGSTLYFIRLDDNDNPKYSGDPYCSICSKIALDVGINKFTLWHKQGWTAYDTYEYNNLTFQYK